MLARAAALFLQRKAPRRLVSLYGVLHRGDLSGSSLGGGGRRRAGLEGGGVFDAQRGIERGGVVAGLALLQHDHLHDTSTTR